MNNNYHLPCYTISSKMSTMLMMTISSTNWTIYWDRKMMGLPCIWTWNRSNFTTSFFWLTRWRISLGRTSAFSTVATKVEAIILIRDLMVTKQLLESAALLTNCCTGSGALAIPIFPSAAANSTGCTATRAGRSLLISVVL
jgi:hypothetical protein